MAVERTSTTTVTPAAPVDKAAEADITADTFKQMLDVLEALATHNHTFYDDYNTVCECQCQCQCSRGTF